MSEQLYLARKTIIEMLEDRGFKNKFIKNYAYSYFNEMYNFVETLNEIDRMTSYNHILDFLKKYLWGLYIGIK